MTGDEPLYVKDILGPSRSPFRGLIFAIPLSLALWVGIIALVWWLVTAL